MKSQRLARLKLPDAPGVYTFRDYRKRPLYIGRATSLKDRVRSYFSADLIETRGVRIVDMVAKAASLAWQETDSVLEAILLESLLIKKYQPFYNVDERDDRSSQYIVITDEAWPRVFLARARDFDQAIRERTLLYKVKRYFGPFLESGLINAALKILRRLFPFRDKKALDPRHEEFYRVLGQSPETDGSEAQKKYRRTIRYLTLFFEGKSQRVRTLLEREMKRNARALKFEQASENRKLIHALRHINDIALIKQNGNGTPLGARGDHRIEAYDIAHLSGTNTAGSMAVSINGQLVPSEYRKFKIKRDANNDLAGLVEILSRRFNHTEWPYPDLVVVDGNEMQIRAAGSVLKARRIDIPVVAVTKDQSHRAASLIGPPEVIEAYKKDIIAVNSEAHRFAIKYHRLRRSRAGLA
ncbi:MAG: excinuclease subunit [Candidatus Parcubacteria bacterium]|jgi:excinuclease ABC subunit C|nr:excinuclease subunit [Candidatus Parcubacteria bacterium]